jgi:hypothetical protein
MYNHHKYLRHIHCIRHIRISVLVESLPITLGHSFQQLVMITTTSKSEMVLRLKLLALVPSPYALLAMSLLALEVRGSGNLANMAHLCQKFPLFLKLSTNGIPVLVLLVVGMEMEIP